MGRRRVTGSGERVDCHRWHFRYRSIENPCPRIKGRAAVVTGSGCRGVGYGRYAGTVDYGKWTIAESEYEEGVAGEEISA